MSISYVYLIDDDPDCLTSTKFLLQAYGYKCVAYSSATEFLDAIPDNAKGVVLADHRLRDGNSISIIRALRKAGQEIPLVIISGRVESEFSKVAKENGVAGIVLKPVSAEELTAVLDKAMLGDELSS